MLLPENSHHRNDADDIGMFGFRESQAMVAFVEVCRTGAMASPLVGSRMFWFCMAALLSRSGTPGRLLA